jgi:FtsH-binding integral membrane protein
MVDYPKQAFAKARATTRYDEGLRSYMLSVYNNMGIALVITAVMSYLIGTSETLLQMLYGSGLIWAVIFAPLVMVFFVVPKILEYSVQKAQIVLWVFSALMGISLSYIFAIYTGESIVRTFLVTAATFGSMSLYGYTTKKDLTSMASFLLMGLFGIIIASLVNLFLHSSALNFAISVIAVLAFTGLTAYDTQNLKKIYHQVGGHSDVVGRVAVHGALRLYMDFINLFIYLLNFMGSRRD